MDSTSGRISKKPTTLIEVEKLETKKPSMKSKSWRPKKRLHINMLLQTPYFSTINPQCVNFRPTFYVPIRPTTLPSLQPIISLQVKTLDTCVQPPPPEIRGGRVARNPQAKMTFHPQNLRTRSILPAGRRLLDAGSCMLLGVFFTAE
jgi:hypothetical protein